MVYCGKPSRACLECRVKRRKCDLSRPACRQCVRAGSRCDGYRDRNSLTFRDQTVEILGKTQSFSDNCPPLTSLHGVHAVFVRSQRSQQALPYQSKERSDHDPWLRVVVSHENQALHFFCNHYLIRGSGQTPGHPDCFAVIYARATGRGYLANLITAVGLASLAYLRDTPALAHAASRMYSWALCDIRASLADPVQASSDQMLVGVMLLVLYETVTCNSDNDMSSWDRHVDGALALIQLRGISQLRNRVGRSLFVNLRTEILVNCLQRRVRVPTTMIRWMCEARHYETAQEEPTGSLADIIVNACAILASTKEEIMDKGDLSYYISMLLSIDQDLERWTKRIPATYEFTTTITNDTDMYVGQCHTYSSVEMAHTWNLQRCARIILCQALIRELSPHLNRPSSLPYSHMLRNANDVIQENSNDLCYSVSYILSFCDKPGKISDLRAGRGIPLLWPLYIAGTAHTATDTLRDWVLVQLKKIREGTGIQRAEWVASHIKRYY